MNPAQSFGSALAAGEWHQFWIYVLAPLIGAALGALAYQLVRGEHPELLGEAREVERSALDAVDGFQMKQHVDKARL